MEGLALQCMSGTSTILTEENERSKSVDESSSYIFSSIMPPLNQFPDRCQHTHITFEKKSFHTVPAKRMSPMFRKQDICFHVFHWR